MPSIEIDVTGLHGLVADLEQAASEVTGKARPVVASTAAKVARAMKADLDASPAFAGGSGPVTFDMKGNAVISEAEIGLERGNVGLANIAYFGGAHGGGGTVRDPIEPAEEEAGAFEAALGKIVDDLL